MHQKNAKCKESGMADKCIIHVLELECLLNTCVYTFRVYQEVDTKIPPAREVFNRINTIACFIYIILTLTGNKNQIIVHTGECPLVRGSIKWFHFTCNQDLGIVYYRDHCIYLPKHCPGCYGNCTTSRTPPCYVIIIWINPHGRCCGLGCTRRIAEPILCCGSICSTAAMQMPYASWMTKFRISLWVLHRYGRLLLFQFVGMLNVFELVLPGISDRTKYTIHRTTPGIKGKIKIV